MAIKPNNPGATIEVPWFYDDAIDREKSDLDALEEECEHPTGNWKKHAVLKDGQLVTRFVIGVIPPGPFARLMTDAGGIPSLQVYWHAFLFGLRDIIDGPTSTTHTTKDGVPEAVPKNDVGGMKCVDEAWLSKVFSGPKAKAAYDVGRAIYNWHVLPEKDLKN